MKHKHKPISPHLQVYRLPVTALMSISHRVTGVGLSLGMILLAFWVIFAAFGASAYEDFHYFLSSWLGLVILFGFSFSLFYHLCNGLRHLFWDAGKFFDLEATRISDIIVLISSILMTALTWLSVSWWGA